MRAKILTLFLFPAVCFAQISIIQQGSGGGGQANVLFGSQTATIASGTAAIDCSFGNSVLLTVTGSNTAVTFTNQVNGLPYFLRVNTGTFNQPTITFPAGAVQTLSGTNVYTASGTGTAVVDVVPFVFSGTILRILDASVYYTP